jgi:hypothetical protein
LNSGLEAGAYADANTAGSQMDISEIRKNLFRYLLALSVPEGGHLVDLGAGPCIFARIARDAGYLVTAVDARTERKPSDAELGNIRFVESDVRAFTLAGFDVICCLGLLYHLELADQIELLKKCVAAGVPVILETQVHVQHLVPEQQKGDWIRRMVRVGDYVGVIFPENSNPMASIGNPLSFWPSNETLLRMFADAGVENATVVDPIFQSVYGARRFYLLNCKEYISQNKAETLILQANERARIIKLVADGQCDEAWEWVRKIDPAMTPAGDWQFAVALFRMHLKLGHSEEAIACVIILRNLALEYGQKMPGALERCAEFFERAGDLAEADRTRRMASERQLT